jgi:hypothetical protein
MKVRPALCAGLLCAIAGMAVAAPSRPDGGAGETQDANHPAFGSGVQRVPIKPPGFRSGKESRGSAKTERHDCIKTDEIAEAMVMGDRSIELTLSDGRRVHMIFAGDCPFLGFYEGFYLQRRRSGKLCAGADKVIARSGGVCAIAGLEERPAPE